MAWEGWRRNTMISTNQSKPIDQWEWTTLFLNNIVKLFQGVLVDLASVLSRGLDISLSRCEVEVGGELLTVGIYLFLRIFWLSYLLHCARIRLKLTIVCRETDIQVQEANDDQDKNYPLNRQNIDQFGKLSYYIFVKTCQEGQGLRVKNVQQAYLPQRFIVSYQQGKKLIGALYTT